MENANGGGINTKIVIGIIIILAGLIALLDNIGMGIGLDFWDFWPLIIIVIGLGKLAQPREYRSTTGALILIVVGVLFQLSTLDIIDFRFRHLWPIILILVGLAILRHGFWRTPKDAVLDSDYINFMAILGGGEYKYSSKDLRGGNATAFMGGGDINMTGADMKGDSMVIDAFVMMGGIDIIVPPHWDVVVKGIPILGGIGNKTIRGAGQDSQTAQEGQPKRLIIKGLVIMGGVEVKNQK